MIKVGDKTVAEVSPPNLAVNEKDFKGNRLLLDSPTLNTLYEYSAANNSIVYNNNGIKSFKLDTPNRIVGTDQNGNLALFERRVLPDKPPANRVLIHTKRGLSTAQSPITSGSITLEGPYWYEIEVVGAGGGGGGGTIIKNTKYALKSGGVGGDGGYYRGQIAVSKTRELKYQLGCPGGGAIEPTWQKSGKKVTSVGRTQGGAGGNTPFLSRYKDTTYSDEARYNTMDGKQAMSGTGYSDTNLPGGSGIDSGASGGGSYSNQVRACNTGAGALGPYGGRGGTYRGTGGGNTVVPGAGGGAGGGFGQGGFGASRLRESSFGYPTYSLTASAQNKSVTDSPAKSYGAGSGGSGSATGAYAGGAGGGGGGGVYVTSGDFELLVGGGGGGAGAGSHESNTVEAGGDGKSNLTSMSNTGVITRSGSGGNGGESRRDPKDLEDGAWYSGTANSGSPAQINIYRLED